MVLNQEWLGGIFGIYLKGYLAMSRDMLFIYLFAPRKESYGKSRKNIKNQKHHFANKAPYIQSYGISSSHVWMWEKDHEEGWVLKNWCFWIVVLENSWESLELQGDQTNQS